MPKKRKSESAATHKPHTRKTASASQALEVEPEQLPEIVEEGPKATATTPVKARQSRTVLTAAEEKVAEAYCSRVSSGQMSKSAAIRDLLSAGWAVGKVAKGLGLRYQYVYQIARGGKPKPKPN